VMIERNSIRSFGLTGLGTVPPTHQLGCETMETNSVRSFL
jgi:hypothetical protein